MARCKYPQSPDWKPDQFELAWAAGFFDGEGWVASGMSSNGTKKRYRHLALTISQVDPEVLERFAKAVGRGIVRQPYAPDARGNRRPLWRYDAYGHCCVPAIIDLLWPYLSSIKRKQASEALLRYEESEVS